MVPALRQGWPLAGMTGLLSALHGKPLDMLYAMLVHRLSPNGIFFAKGWGDLDKVDWLQGAEGLDWPPPELKASWTVIRKGTSHGVKFSILEGKFRSPVSAVTWDALPRESQAGRVQLLVPEAPTDSLACVLHLPGTGDQGFSRRLSLGFPLLRHVSMHKPSTPPAIPARNIDAGCCTVPNGPQPIHQSISQSIEVVTASHGNAKFHSAALATKQWCTPQPDTVGMCCRILSDTCRF
ncbi:unnamed protein product [Ostreobium quekettii]|uniref:Uncharacterized protein n=1 Tax=Ostreobium quekettii TaxID=121088 RepID=A0A8S1ITM1_9CHLO|nr:unnamed protein product [Ostreobium quekettii]|eukprot:evm.model.scf_60.8 EVM.evm.TU.scf_60.8   scf_60:87627-90042(+)